MNITTSTGKSIAVYDDLFSYHERDKWFAFITGSFFKVNGGDSSTAYGSSWQLFSSFSEDDLLAMGFYSSAGFKHIDEIHGISKRRIKQIRVNMSYLGESNVVHTDTDGLTLLYYPNLDWKLEWGGHTLFMDDNLNNPEYTCLYKPGRVVVFDGSIPHMIMTPTAMANTPRFSFVIQTES